MRAPKDQKGRKIFSLTVMNAYIDDLGELNAFVADRLKSGRTYFQALYDWRRKHPIPKYDFEFAKMIAEKEMM